MTADVLMCTYNGEEFIAQQIQSILDQTHTDFRLIIIDDRSNDRTVEIIEEMMLLDHRIEFYQNEQNLGYFNNFLLGLKYVNADYLFFSDQDDIWVNNKIEVQLADLMQEDENVLMNFSNSYLLFDEINSTATFETKRNPQQIRSYYSSPIELSLRNIVAGHTILIRASKIPAISEKLSRIVDKKELYFDYVLTLVLLDYGKIKYLNQSLVYFRQHANSTSTKMRMNYYKYISSNSSAFSKISESTKMNTYFSALHKATAKTSNFVDYLRLLPQNLIHHKHIFNNYDFYHVDVQPSFFKRINKCFALTYKCYLQK
ncbi:MAG: glycosyltransferase [Bacteroidota bacterium]